MRDQLVGCLSSSVVVLFLISRCLRLLRVSFHELERIVRIARRKGRLLGRRSPRDEATGRIGREHRGGVISDDHQP